MNGILNHVMTTCQVIWDRSKGIIKIIRSENKAKEIEKKKEKNRILTNYLSLGKTKKIHGEKSCNHDSVE